MNYYYEENTWGERFIPDLNRTVFQNASAASYFENELDFDLLEPNKLTIIVGSDSGLLYKYLCSQPIPASSRIIIIEPADVFEIVNEECQQWLSTQAPQTAEPVVSLHLVENLDSEVLNDSDTAFFFAGKIQQTQAKCATQDYQNIYYPLYREVREILATRAHVLQNRYSIKLYVEQQMNNCIDNHTPMRAQPDFGKDRVAVIMGGGPSLDDQLDWIVHNRSKIFLIAVSRICGKLHKLHLIPDMVVAVDSHPVTYAAAKMGTHWEHVPLASSYHVAHELLKQWRGPHYFLGYRYPWEAMNREPTDTVESVGPTVGHSAIVLAERLGFSTILLAGIDLCLNASGGSHAQGTPEAELLKLPGTYEARVTTYAGNQAGIPLGFYRGIDSLNTIGQEINQHSDKLFNLNIDAAKIPSIKYLNAKNVTLPESKPRFDTSEYAELTTDQLSALAKKLMGHKREFEKIKDIASKAKACIDQIYGKNGKPPNPEYHQRLDALEARLNKVSSYAIDTVRYFMAPEFAQLRKPSGFDAMEEDDMELWVRQYYKITHRGARYFQQALESSLETIELRKAEQSSTPDIDYLIKKWTDVKTPGRVSIFRENLLEYATDDQIILLQQSDSAYFQSLLTKDEVHEKLVVHNYGTIRKTMQSLRYLRDKKCVSDLQSYYEKLKDMEWPYGTIASFIKGNLAEINAENELSIEQYQKVIDNCGEQLNAGDETLESIGTLIEESLTNLTRIYLDQQDGDSAASTLGTLCEITPQYIPSYANLLNLLGNYESAVELLEIYLANFKHDYRAARQLVQLHKNMGNNEAHQKAVQLAEGIRNKNTLTTKAA
ncbi:6-hydroxymethylpterin diphosphokinase MptE-like protein [Granulosicoccus antarcticus]|uniref:6-hydroxymethylpterin diphosphokinase MptE-like domain-containing protein n=1 Tax=Granulosicoccus antarcticus IMCC3135 TaxID=1192854 RepID=A0A2Z2NYB7_9GAMM|nr:6-hydroxymethylpterin diphosphokinase MptE-like protein [Granulosicoccus antarcticus]ASJ74921.1 hypothetical protein IMCC3135_24265 [Granulosicoccus antarcticus IMCC3135]